MIMEVWVKTVSAIWSKIILKASPAEVPSTDKDFALSWEKKTLNLFG